MRGVWKYKGKGKLLRFIKKRKANWLGYMLRWYCVIGSVIEEEIKEREDKEQQSLIISRNEAYMKEWKLVDGIEWGHRFRS